MDMKTEVRDFLTSRRAKITPAEAGLTTYGTRQVPGLRPATRTVCRAVQWMIDAMTGALDVATQP
jgi:hypothetical protein